MLGITGTGLSVFGDLLAGQHTTSTLSLDRDQSISLCSPGVIALH